MEYLVKIPQNRVDLFISFVNKEHIKIKKRKKRRIIKGDISLSPVMFAGEWKSLDIDAQNLRQWNRNYTW